MDETISCSNRHPHLVLDNDANRQLPREFSSEDGCTRELSLSTSVTTEYCDIRLIADRLQDASCQ
jgi:hypothetical protein